jgi:hypothetical protein
MMPRVPVVRLLWFAAVVFAVTLAYANHFHNAFHFDDSHAVVFNPYIRDVHNIPRFFTDARTFTVLPRNRMYRPILSTTLAVDYWLGDGLEPFWFHASTFFWYLVQLALMYSLFRKICDLARPDPRNYRVALTATAWYGLHPGMAETVNYVVQRGDLFVALGVIAAIWVYVARPALRKYGLYLLPAATAILCKPPALIFPAILFFYVWLFEFDAEPRSIGKALLRCAPAFLVAAALGGLTVAMTPKEFNPSGVPPYAFRITQPLVALRFFRTFFVPNWLSADTDLRAVPSIWQHGAWAGFLFVAAVIAAAVASTPKRDLRPVAFGLWWFLLALAPTSLFVVAEVENDHRMFFPFVGLVLACSWPVALWIYSRPPARRSLTIALCAVGLCELVLLGAATRQRNVVWHSEESLWWDVTQKSPRNGRGLRLYAMTQWWRGNLDRALEYLNRAAIYTPFDPMLEMQLGIVTGDLGRTEEAERHYLQAIKWNPTDAFVRDAYAQWLEREERWPDTLGQLRIAVDLNPDHLETFDLLMKFYAKRDLWAAAKKVANYVLSRFPAERSPRAYLLMAARETVPDPVSKSL